MNFFDAKLVKDADGKYAVELENAHVVLSDEKQARLAANNVEPQDITLGVRPEHINLVAEGTGTIAGSVDVTEMMGSAIHLHMQACGRDVIAIVQTLDVAANYPNGFSLGQKIAFSFGGNVAHVFGKDGLNLEG
jgi:multiple sugar transport system ATP-binding protein